MHGLLLAFAAVGGSLRGEEMPSHKSLLQHQQVKSKARNR